MGTPPQRRQHPSGATKGQTTIDFAIGIAIFLGVVVFAFTFVPGILQPFTVTGDQNPSLSDRAADSLAEDMLGAPEQPYVLDRYCTVAFFNGSNDAADSCRYTDASLPELFNLDSIRNVNVTLSGNVTDADTGRQQLCWATESPVGTDEPGLVERGHPDCAADDVVLARGDEITTGGSATITARRVVSLNGESVTLEVVLW